MDLKNIKDSLVFSDNTFTKRILYADNQTLCFVLNLKKGQSLPLHRHESSTLVMYVLKGKGEIKINNETGVLEEGAFVSARGEDDFEIPSVAEDMSALVSISPNPSSSLYSKPIG